MKLQEYVGLQLIDKGINAVNGVINYGSTQEIALSPNSMYIVIGWCHVATHSVNFCMVSTYGSVRFHDVVNSGSNAYMPSYSADGYNFKITSPSSYRSNYIVLKIS